MAQETGTSSLEKGLWERFGKVATIVGFIVDSIAILSIIFSIKTGQELPRFISPLLIIVILFLSTFSYLGYLHSYWNKNRQIYSPRFFSFLKNDLLLDFESPVRLFPFILIIAILYIVVTITLAGWWQVVFQIFCGMAIGGLAIVISAEKSLHDQSLAEKFADEECRKSIERNWDSWEDRINFEISSHYWITPENFNDISLTTEITRQGIYYAFALYANRYPDKARIASVYKRGNDWYSIAANVLVNVNALSQNETYYYKQT